MTGVRSRRTSALPLFARAGIEADDQVVRLLRVTRGDPSPEFAPRDSLLLRDYGGNATPSAPESISWGGVGWFAGETPISHPPSSLRIELPGQLAYLDEGDIVRINPHAQRVNVIYRRSSPSNSLLFTERCNSHCLMCSQPPRDIDDSYLVDEMLAAIPLMDRATAEIGITGGEPTLDFPGLIRVLESIRAQLPATAVHVLTNGRLFAYTRAAMRVRQAAPADLMLGVPLYSADPERHDFVVQARGAFDQTVRGMLNLARAGVSVEIRVVLHRQTTAGLPALAEYIARNLPFVSQVALMGLEPMGHVKMNLSALWIDPVDYQHELCEAVHTLNRAGIRALIYNHQLCTLDSSLRSFAVQSISDWKNIEFPECDACAASDLCAGFFASATLKRSRAIRALTPPEIAEMRSMTMSHGEV